MDGEGEGRICEGEKWALGTGDRQTQRDRRQEALDVQIPLQWLPLSLRDGEQVVSDSEEREGHAGGLQIKERCEESSRRLESEGLMGVYCDCQVSTTVAM